MEAFVIVFIINFIILIIILVCVTIICPKIRETRNRGRILAGKVLFDFSYSVSAGFHELSALFDIL